jgi:hypothetical protein
MQADEHFKIPSSTFFICKQSRGFNLFRQIPGFSETNYPTAGRQFNSCSIPTLVSIQPTALNNFIILLRRTAQDFYYMMLRRPYVNSELA